MDLCYKSDHLQENFGIVHLKSCPEGKMCHGKLNRCMYDPFATFEGKLPGQECNYNYQCLSNSCSMRINDETFACEGLKEN